MRQPTLAAALALSLALACQADSLSLVTGNDYAPFADSKLPNGGLAAEVAVKAFAESKTEVKLDWSPWARGYEEAKSGRYAATFPYVKSAEREKDFIYSAPIYEIQQRAFAKPGSKFDFGHVASLAGSTVCVPLGWAPSASLLPLIKSGQIKKSEPKDISTCAQMVAAGRADYFVTDQFQGRTAIKGANLPADALTASSVVLESETLHLIAGRATPQGRSVIAAFDKGLETLRKNGGYDRIVAAHTR
ncbi:substrate-binding periplasmic protein [Chitinimonas koreensis]|uniref:substrate-binding periplasmic protein n=1 Tax=Chitinimonas koreensis TaxID=356302 RepID=UPI000410F5C0|nr:transporter substrate-binding domain-containing protein [Chitinimonas koreensis]QNM98477.1 transporter substrate-binding domain-containing protein [Chitinimonas koreensis]